MGNFPIRRSNLQFLVQPFGRVNEINVLRHQDGRSRFEFYQIPNVMFATMRWRFRSTNVQRAKVKFKTRKKFRLER